jgi:hypothetical protein
VSAASLAWPPPAAGLWLRLGGGLLLAGAAMVALVWLAVHAWRWLRAVGNAAVAAAPGGALATVTGRTADLEDRFGDVARRLDRLEALSEAREQDDRQRHDGELVEVLGALLDLNEALRAPLGSPRQAEAPAPLAAGARVATDARAAAGKEQQ